ncbi:hypothetical protein TKK_0010292 [Trichogramma kaykai]
MINENIKSHISELKRFECLSYIKIPVAENKFSKKAIVAYLVGHTPTGYLMWHPQTNRFITSRHVQFNEKVVYQDRVQDQENDTQTKKIIEQLVFESEPITFEANKIDEQIEHATLEVIEPPKGKAITTKRKNIPEPRRMPERRAKKQKLMDPNFVYKAKVPELKIDDIEVHANLAKTNKDPASYKVAIQSEDRDKWTAAIEEELKSMKDNNVWTVIDKPEKNLNGQKLNLIDSKWVFKRKIDENGKEKFKARLVIRGFKDKNSYELKETYAPVSRLSTIRTALAVINKLDLKTVLLDVKTAFLNGNLADEIYMEIPDRLKVSKEKVCKLQKTISPLLTSKNAHHRSAVKKNTPLWIP